MDDGAVALDAREVDDGRERDVEAEEAGELVEGFVQDLVCAVDEPDNILMSLLSSASLGDCTYQNRAKHTHTGLNQKANGTAKVSSTAMVCARATLSGKGCVLCWVAVSAAWASDRALRKAARAAACRTTMSSAPSEGQSMVQRMGGAVEVRVLSLCSRFTAGGAEVYGAKAARLRRSFRVFLLSRLLLDMEKTRVRGAFD